MKHLNFKSLISVTSTFMHCFIELSVIIKQKLHIRYDLYVDYITIKFQNVLR